MPNPIDCEHGTALDGWMYRMMMDALEKAGTMLVPTEGSKEWTVIARARSCIGKGYVYKLGAGGRNPNNKTPLTVRDGVLGSDCAGFVSWAWGFDRFQDYTMWMNGRPGQFSPGSLESGEVKTYSSMYNKFDYYGGWINTDSMMEDAYDNNADWFTHLESPIPGCIVSYGSTGTGSHRRIGHEGLVVSAPAIFDRENPEHWKRLRVIDCRSARGGQPAILERDGMTWFGKDRKGRVKGSVFCWPRFVAGDAPE